MRLMQRVEARLKTAAENENCADLWQQAQQIVREEAIVALRDANATEPVLRKYGLESMTGNALEILERHLNNNSQAAIGGYQSIIERLGERQAATAQLLDLLRTADDGEYPPREEDWLAIVAALRQLPAAGGQ